MIFQSNSGKIDNNSLTISTNFKQNTNTVIFHFNSGKQY